MFWVAILAVSILLYVLLDGFDLGIGILFGLTRDEARRRAMLSAVAPIWDGNETWLVVAGVVLWGAFPIVYATLFSAFCLLSSAPCYARGPDPARCGVRVPLQGRPGAVDLGCRLCRRISPRRLRPRHDGRGPRRGPSDRQWPLHRRRIRLAQLFFGIVRRRPLPRLCTSGCLLACQEMRD